MQIELKNLSYDEKTEINVKIDYDESYIKNTDILELNGVLVTGSISGNTGDGRDILLLIEGDMYLEDAITLEKVPYHFKSEIEEKLENSLKTLDLNEFLWHHIVLEIPIRYTTSNINELKGVYQDIYEEDELVEVNNPFKDFFEE